MRRTIAGIVMCTSALVTPAVTAAPAQARCAAPGSEVVYVFKNKSFTYHPTNIKSDWAMFRKGGTISYSKSDTMEVNASATATVQAEAGVIFAKASTSLGITVGGSKSWTDTWTYTANVPASKKRKYRLHAYHYTANFSVMKKRFNGAPSVCDYRNVWKKWQRVKHAPATASRNIWKVDKARA